MSYVEFVLTDSPDEDGCRCGEPPNPPCPPEVLCCGCRCVPTEAGDDENCSFVSFNVIGDECPEGYVPVDDEGGCNCDTVNDPKCCPSPGGGGNCCEGAACPEGLECTGPPTCTCKSTDDNGDDKNPGGGGDGGGVEIDGQLCCVDRLDPNDPNEVPPEVLDSARDPQSATPHVFDSNCAAKIWFR